MPTTQRTLAQVAYGDIRAMILDGALPPGSKLIVRMLSEKLGLSATPIKSALAALERDGFLVATPHRGFRVPEIGLSDMREIYELREALDGIAARRVARSDGAAELARTVLRPLIAEQREHGMAGDLAAMRDRDRAFHQAIWHASGNGRLARVTDNLGGQIRLAWQVRGSDSVERGLREHQAIVDAIAAGDALRAEGTSRAHVRSSWAAFAKAAQETTRSAGRPPSTGSPTIRAC